MLYVNQRINIDIEYKFLDDYFRKRIIILFSELGFRQDVVKSSIVK